MLLKSWACFRWVLPDLSAVFGMFITIVKKGHVVIPKAKILVSMFQVQQGLSPTFQLTLPEQFIRFMQHINVWDINLPLDCLYRVDFHGRLVFRTVSPLVLFVAFLFAGQKIMQGSPQAAGDDDDDERDGGAQEPLRRKSAATEQLRRATFWLIAISVILIPPWTPHGCYSIYACVQVLRSPQDKHWKRSLLLFRQRCAIAVGTACVSSFLVFCMSIYLFTTANSIAASGVPNSCNASANGANGTACSADKLADEASFDRAMALYGLVCVLLSIIHIYCTYRAATKVTLSLRGGSVGLRSSTTGTFADSFTGRRIDVDVLRGMAGMNLSSDLVKLKERLDAQGPPPRSVSIKPNKSSKSTKLKSGKLTMFGAADEEDAGATRARAPTIMDYVRERAATLTSTHIELKVGSKDASNDQYEVLGLSGEPAYLSEHAIEELFTRTDEDLEWRSSTSAWCIDTAMLICFLVYPGTSSNVFRTFSCQGFDDGTSYLRADYSINCATSSHRFYSLYASLMIALYPFGLPLLYTACIYWHRNQLRLVGRIQDVLKSQRRQGEDLWVYIDPNDGLEHGPVALGELIHLLRSPKSTVAETTRVRLCGSDEGLVAISEQHLLRDAVEIVRKNLDATKAATSRESRRELDQMSRLSGRVGSSKNLNASMSGKAAASSSETSKGQDEVTRLVKEGMSNLSKDKDVDTASSQDASVEGGLQQRARAFNILAENHHHLGLQLDPKSAEPVIIRVWPTFEFSPIFNELEESLAFEFYFKFRKNQLVEDAKVEYKQRAKELVRKERAESVKKGETTKDSKFDNIEPDFLSPTWTVLLEEQVFKRAQHEWRISNDVFKLGWLQTRARLQPLPGDVLVAVDGKEVPTKGVADYGHFSFTESCHRAHMAPWEAKREEELEVAKNGLDTAVTALRWAKAMGQTGPIRQALEDALKKAQQGYDKKKKEYEEAEPPEWKFTCPCCQTVFSSSNDGRTALDAEDAKLHALKERDVGAYEAALSQHADEHNGIMPRRVPTATSHSHVVAYRMLQQAGRGTIDAEHRDDPKHASAKRPDGVLLTVRRAAANVDTARVEGCCTVGANEEFKVRPSLSPLCVPSAHSHCVLL